MAVKKKVFKRANWAGNKNVKLGTVDSDGYKLTNIEEGIDLVWETWTK